jgi:uncharacterized membrane protein
MGPVQVLVIAFDEPTFSGAVLDELAKLREAGIVRLIDLLVVRRDVDGTIETLDAPGDAEAGSGSLAAVVFGQADEESVIEDGIPTWSLADAIPAGSAAAVALIEHLWAGPLSDAIRGAGGTVVEETWLAPDDRVALEALMSER